MGLTPCADLTAKATATTQILPKGNKHIGQSGSSARYEAATCAGRGEPEPRPPLLLLGRRGSSNPDSLKIDKINNNNF